MKHTLFSPLLYLIRAIFRLIRDIDSLFTWFSYLLFKPRYNLSGQCKKRGLCCENIGIQLSPSVFRHKWIKNLVKHWYTFVYNFSFKGEVPSDCILLFKCNYLKKKVCSIYWKRPYICRRYPHQSLFLKPKFLPGCGYEIDLSN